MELVAVATEEGVLLQLPRKDAEVLVALVGHTAGNTHSISLVYVAIARAMGLSPGDVARLPHKWRDPAPHYFQTEE